jgi:predicted nucleic acid-binding protein
MAILIDTSVLVASERGSMALERLIQPGETYASSVITAAELLHGVHRATGRRAQARSAFVEGMLNAFAPLPVDMPVARAYARTSATLAKSGTSVDANDLWIGATAIAASMEVLALDGDFERIPGLRRASGS